MILRCERGVEGPYPFFVYVLKAIIKEHVHFIFCLFGRFFWQSKYNHALFQNVCLFVVIYRLDDNKKVAGVYWSDHGRYPMLRIAPEEVRPLYRAMKIWHSKLYLPENLFKYKMQNGKKKMHLFRFYAIWSWKCREAVLGSFGPMHKGLSRAHDKSHLQSTLIAPLSLAIRVWQA